MPRTIWSARTDKKEKRIKKGSKNVIHNSMQSVTLLPLSLRVYLFFPPGSDYPSFSPLFNILTKQLLNPAAACFPGIDSPPVSLLVFRFCLETSRKNTHHGWHVSWLGQTDRQEGFLSSSFSGGVRLSENKIYEIGCAADKKIQSKNNKIVEKNE